MGLRTNVIVFTLGAGTGAVGGIIGTGHGDLIGIKLPAIGQSSGQTGIDNFEIQKTARDTIKTALISISSGATAALSAWYLRRRADLAAQKGQHRQSETTCTNSHTLEKQADGRVEVKIIPGGESPTQNLFREQSLPAHLHSHTRAFHRGENLPLYYGFPAAEALLPVGLMRFAASDERHVLQGLKRRYLNDEKQADRDAVEALRTGKAPAKAEVYLCFRRDDNDDQPTTWINKFPAEMVDTIVALVTPDTVRIEPVPRGSKLRGFEIVVSGALKEYLDRMFTVPGYRQIVITDLLQIAMAVKFGGDFNQHGICSPASKESEFARYLAPVMKVSITLTEAADRANTLEQQRTALFELAMAVMPKDPENGAKLLRILQGHHADASWAVDAVDKNWEATE